MKVALNLYLFLFSFTFITVQSIKFSAKLNTLLEKVEDYAFHEIDLKDSKHGDHHPVNPPKDTTTSLIVTFNQNTKLMTAHHSEGKHDISNNYGEIICSTAHFENNIQEIGWDKISVTTYKECDPEYQMYAAGFAEGTLTYKQIADFKFNIFKQNGDLKTSSKFFKETLEKLHEKYSVENFKKWQNEAKEEKTLGTKKESGKSPSDNLLYNTFNYMYFIQLYGILHGYNRVVKSLHTPEIEEMTIETLALLNADGQLSELEGLSAYSDSTCLKEDRKLRKKKFSRTLRMEKL